MPGLLDGKKLLITGVLTDDSIAFGVAQLAQEQGAEIALTSFGRVMRLTERVARKLPDPDVEILELDVQDPSHVPGAHRRAGGEVGPPRRRAPRHRQRQPGDVPRRRHPQGAVGRRRRRRRDLRLLAQGAWPDRVPAAAEGDRRRVDRRARLRRRAWPGRSTTGWAWPRRRSSRRSRYLARDLGPLGIRVNLVAAGPLRTMSAKSIPGFAQFEETWTARAPARLGPPGHRAGRQGVRRAVLGLVPGDDRRDRPRRRRRPRHRGVNLYEVLDVRPWASPDEVRAAHRRAVRALHPDTRDASLPPAEADAALRLVNQAWEVLGDPSRRRRLRRIALED